MKKIIAKITLAVLLVGGFAFVANEVQSTQVADGEIVPLGDPGGGGRPTT